MIGSEALPFSKTGGLADVLGALPQALAEREAELKQMLQQASGQRGLVCQYDVVCFDEVSGISFDQKDGVNIMKGYMESGEFSRGKESIRAEGGVVLVGNFDADPQPELVAVLPTGLNAKDGTMAHRSSPIFCCVSLNLP